MSRTQGHYDYEERVLHKLGINTGFWQKWLKPQIREHKGNKCETCGSKEDLDIHHSSYESITIHTLKLLCHSCHLIADKEFKSSDSGNYPNNRGEKE